MLKILHPDQSTHEDSICLVTNTFDNTSTLFKISPQSKMILFFMERNCFVILVNFIEIEFIGLFFISNDIKSNASWFISTGKSYEHKYEYNFDHLSVSISHLPTASFSMRSRNSSILSGSISASTMIANGAELSKVVLANEADEANGAGGTNAKERETAAASRTRLLETFIFLFSYKLKSITSVSVLLVSNSATPKKIRNDIFFGNSSILKESTHPIWIPKMRTLFSSLEQKENFRGTMRMHPSSSNRRI